MEQDVRDDELVDEFGRTFEEQLQDQIEWEYVLDSDQHRIHEEYVSDDQYQDSEEDLPFGFHVTYENGGAQYKIEEPYLALWHRDKAITLLNQSYEHLLQYFD